MIRTNNLYITSSRVKILEKGFVYFIEKGDEIF